MYLIFPELMQYRATLLGERGQNWLNGVPTLMRELAERWQLTPVQQLSGGTEALVILVKTAAGSAVLKIGLPGTMDRETEALRLADGRGYAKLLDCDPDRCALLIEPLGEQLAHTQLSVEQQITILCGTLQVAWRHVEEDKLLLSGADKAQTQADYILSQWEVLNRPCPRRVIDQALACAQERKSAHDPRSCYLIHGDAHIWNTLQAPDSATGYKFVDPDGLAGERAIDLAISMREWRDELLSGDARKLGRQRCSLLSELTGIDSDAIWQWGLMEHVACGLLDLHLQDHNAAEQHFVIAEQWCRP